MARGFAMNDHVLRGPSPAHGAVRLDLGERIAGGPRGWQRSDERIHDEVCRTLTDDGWVDASNVEVIVHERVVTLAGSVPDRRQRARAVDLAESVRGVLEVVSRIHVG